MRIVEGKSVSNVNERRETLTSCIKEETTVSRELDRKKKITAVKRRTLETRYETKEKKTGHEEDSSFFSSWLVIFNFEATKKTGGIRLLSLPGRASHIVLYNNCITEQARSDINTYVYLIIEI